MSNSISIARNAAQEIAVFLGKLPIESGAANYYNVLRASLSELPQNEGVTVVKKGGKVGVKLKVATSVGVADASKVEAKRKKAAENARKWRQKKALEKSAAQAAASNPAPVPETVQPVLFTG